MRNRKQKAEELLRLVACGPSNAYHIFAPTN